ncbi:MAG: hypothetical protein HQK51_02070 [Oligoflexia bacterium]|nr:hypothetical protein [Oligoflexia bacterium]
MKRLNREIQRAGADNVELLEKQKKLEKAIDNKKKELNNTEQALDDLGILNETRDQRDKAIEKWRRKQ